MSCAAAQHATDDRTERSMIVRAEELLNAGNRSRFAAERCVLAFTRTGTLAWNLAEANNGDNPRHTRGLGRCAQSGGYEVESGCGDRI